VRVVVTKPDTISRVTEVDEEIGDFLRRDVHELLDFNVVAQARLRRLGVGMWIYDWSLTEQWPQNTVATQAYWYHRGQTSYPICGPAAFTGFDEEGNDLDAPDWFLDQLVLNGVQLEGWK
jgi:hypothetical protein